MPEESEKLQRCQEYFLSLNEQEKEIFLQLAEILLQEEIARRGESEGRTE